MTYIPSQAKPIALIFGGRGFEREISCKSAGRIASTLEELSLTFISVYITARGDWLKFPSDPAKIKNASSVDCSEFLYAYPVMLYGRSGFLTEGSVTEVLCAIPALHGDFGEDGTVQGALECARIPYLGQGVLAGAVASDKEFTKLLAASVGIPTLPHEVLREPYTEALGALALKRAKERFGYPMFIKPSSLGSSGGALGVNTDEEFHSALRQASELCSGKVLIEKLIKPDLELEIAYLDGDAKIFTHPSCVSLSGEAYDFQKKYTAGGAVTSARADISEDIANKAIDYARRLSELLSLRDLARIDFFLVGEDIYFNEINIGADGIHIGINAITRFDLVFGQGESFPLG